MNATAASVCKAFLLKLPSDEKEHLAKYLSDEDKQFLQDLPADFFQDPSLGFSGPEENLRRVHYTWFAPIFRSFSESEVRLFLSVLNADQSKGLKKLLLFTNHGVELNPSTRPFLQKILWERLTEKVLLPIECLPKSALNDLLELEHDRFLTIIDFLGIHDLAIEAKQIIETAKLKQIYAALTPQELSLLQTLLNRKEPLAFKRMDLHAWDGTKSALRSQIHQRGLNRLAKAVYNKDKSLLWYLSRKLDMEKGELLVKFATPLEHVRAQEILISQVTESLSRF